MSDSKQSQQNPKKLSEDILNLKGNEDVLEKALDYKGIDHVPSDGTHAADVHAVVPESMQQLEGAIAITFNAANVDGTIESVTATVPEEQGRVVVHADNSVTFTPAENFHGDADITVITTDDDGATATQSSTVTVSGVNDTLTLNVQSTATMDEDGGNVAITFNAANVDGTIESVTATVPEEQGSVTVNEDNSLTFTPLHLLKTSMAMLTSPLLPLMTMGLRPRKAQRLQYLMTIMHQPWKNKSV